MMTEPTEVAASSSFLYSCEGMHDHEVHKEGKNKSLPCIISYSGNAMLEESWDR
jgi:hypothetical protein